MRMKILIAGASIIEFTKPMASIAGIAFAFNMNMHKMAGGRFKQGLANPKAMTTTLPARQTHPHVEPQSPKNP